MSPVGVASAARSRAGGVISVLLIAAGLALPSGAVAQLGSGQSAGDGFGFLPLELSVRLESGIDYRVRGISRSDNDFSAGGTARVIAANGLYAQAGLRAVDLAAGEADVESTVRLGYAPDISSAAIDLYTAYTFYPGAPAGADLDHWEVGAEGQVSFGPGSLTGQIAYSPDYIGAIDDALYVNAGLLIPLYEGENGLSASVMGDVGYSFLDGAEDYADWSLGASVGLAPFDLTVEYVDTDLDRGEESDADVLVSLGATLALN